MTPAVPRVSNYSLKDGGHRGPHQACRNGWIAARLKSRGRGAEAEGEISRFLSLSGFYHNSLGEYGFACQIFVLICLPSSGVCWLFVPYVIEA